MKRSSSSADYAEVLTITEKSSMEIETKHSADSLLIQKDKEEGYQIEIVKAKIGEAREENERLKELLAKLLKDHKSLQIRVFNVFQQDDTKMSSQSATQETDKEPELVSLTLGRKSEENEIGNGRYYPKEDEKHKNNQGLVLEPQGTKKRSFESSSVEEEPSKLLKTERTTGDDHEVLPQEQLKKTRVSVRARCDTPTMNDGCQWRKYGQKISKGNPCPRAYYRCTVSQTCPVRKQVQRCSEEMSVLISTYEGTHDHPLPHSATAMASTTSAAASMLQSQSSTSQPGLGTSYSTPLATTSVNGGYTFNFSQTSSRPPYQCYITNPSILNSNSHPTITLDLSSPANASCFNRLNSSTSNRLYTPTCLNFSSSSSSSSSSSLDFNTNNQRNNSFGLMSVGRQPVASDHQQQLYQSDHLPETIDAATKAIAANPNFRSALAAAITSFVGNGGGMSNFTQANSHGGSVRSIVSSTQQQQNQAERSLILFPNSFSTLAESKSASSSHVDNSDHGQ